MQKNEPCLKVKTECPNIEIGVHWSQMFQLSKGDLQRFPVKYTKSVLNSKIMKATRTQKLKIFNIQLIHIPLSSAGKANISNKIDVHQFTSKMLFEGACWQLTIKFDFPIIEIFFTTFWPTLLPPPANHVKLISLNFIF